VVNGRRYVSPSLAQVLAEGISHDAAKPLHSDLSEREFQVFCKLSLGTPVSDIAEELDLSIKTVSTYRTRVLQKMAMHSNAELTYYAIKHGLVR
jgi:DNA-binding NarL/FixJ family response regulator